MSKKKQYTPKEKMRVLREHIENNRAISDLSEKHSVPVMTLYNWRKNLLEQGESTFVRESKKNAVEEALRRQIEELKAKLADREGLISELAESLVEVKKKSSGGSSTVSGSNPRRGTRS
jgi:transposase-like protein